MSLTHSPQFEKTLAGLSLTGPFCLIVAIGWMVFSCPPTLIAIIIASYHFVASLLWIASRASGFTSAPFRTSGGHSYPLRIADISGFLHTASFAALLVGLGVLDMAGAFSSGHNPFDTSGFKSFVPISIIYASMAWVFHPWKAQPETA